MRRTILFSLSAAVFAAARHVGPASAGDRYGPPEPVKPADVSAVEWNGPLLGWTNKGAPDATDPRPAAPASAKAVSSNTQSTVAPLSVSHAAPAQPSALPTSIYDSPPAPSSLVQVATAAGPAPAA